MWILPVWTVEWLSTWITFATGEPMPQSKATLGTTAAASASRPMMMSLAALDREGAAIVPLG